MPKDSAEDTQKYNIAELTKAIGDWYRSEEYRQLMSLNNRETFMHMSKIDRDEEIHSSFLAQIFRTIPCQSISSDWTESSVLLLLRLLAVKAQQQVMNDDIIKISDLMDTSLWNNILTNNCKVQVLRVKTEDYTHGDERNGRADILIDCEIRYPYGEAPFKIRIIIENKIDSKEGKEQCRKYYDYYDKNGESRVKKHAGITHNIFVFLSPHSPEKISDNHFIKIEYSDLLHHVLRPILNNAQLYSEEFTQSLDMYIKTITSYKNSPIAMDEEYIKLARRFYEQNEQLITNVVEAAAGKEAKENLRKARSSQADYTVTYQYNGAAYSSSPTKLNKLAWQMVKVLVDAGWTAKDIQAQFEDVFPKSDFLATSDDGRSEKVTIQGSDYWVKTGVWNTDGSHTKKLFELFGEISGLTYTKS